MISLVLIRALLVHGGTLGFMPVVNLYRQLVLYNLQSSPLNSDTLSVVWKLAAYMLIMCNVRCKVKCCYTLYRYCKIHNIYKSSRLTSHELHQAVADAVEKVSAYLACVCTTH